ncbi:MAG TPA: hypothetical protein VLJ11_18700 [Bryobacteraceae bacterium]|nr:hypothetical protein [Bryobacteraceae bacterium]
MRRPDWMKTIPHEPDPYLDLSTFQAVMWWEIRRPLFNFYLFLVGMVSVILMKALVDRFVSPGMDISTSGIISGTFFYGIAANVWYTFGWIIELFLRRSDPAAARRKAVDLYWTGLKLSCLLTTAPLWFALFTLVRNRV